MRNFYVPGDWNAVCDRCGFKYKASKLRKEWTGLRVCNTCFETRQPQTLIKVPQEHINTAWARPEGDDIFISVSGPLTTEAGESTEYWILTESGIILNTES